MSSAKGIIGLMVGVGLGLLIMWLIRSRTPGGSPKTMINGIPFKPGVSPILDAIGRVQSETNEALRGPLCNAFHTAELGLMKRLEGIQESISCTEFKILLQQERDEFANKEIDEDDEEGKKILINMYTEIDLLIDKINKRFCDSDTSTITGQDITKLIKEVRDGLCYDKDDYDDITMEDLSGEIGKTAERVKLHLYDPTKPYTDVIRESISWIENSFKRGGVTATPPWKNRLSGGGCEQFDSYEISRDESGYRILENLSSEEIEVAGFKSLCGEVIAVIPVINEDTVIPEEGTQEELELYTPLYEKINENCKNYMLSSADPDTYIFEQGRRKACETFNETKKEYEKLRDSLAAATDEEEAQNDT